MQATAAANKGSTRLLEYLSCDGSLSGGGGAFVPDCRRSIIPRLYDLLLLSGWGLAGLIPRVYRCCFAFPSPVWSGRAAGVKPTRLARLDAKMCCLYALLRHQGWLQAAAAMLSRDFALAC